MRLYLGDLDVLRWQFKDAAGMNVDLTGATVELDLYGPQRITGTAVIINPPTDGKVEYRFVPREVRVVGDYGGRWIVHLSSGQITSVPGVVLRILDPAILPWASLITLETILGKPVEDAEKAAAALDSATRAIRATIYTQPDETKPIPDQLQMATALLAASIYAGPPFGEGLITSEVLADYRVHYQYPYTSMGAQAVITNPVLMDLISPWRPRILNAYVGPSQIDAPLPITGEVPAETWLIEGEVAAGTTMTITTEDEMVLDLSPSKLDITGVRAGDSNSRTFMLGQEGVPIDLTGATLEAQARKHHTDIDPAITAVIEIIDPPTDGRFTLSWPGDQVQTVLAGADFWDGVWDLQVTVGTELPVTVLAGTIECEADVTR